MELVKFELHTTFPIPLSRFVFITPISDYIQEKERARARKREKERRKERMLKKRANEFVECH